MQAGWIGGADDGIVDELGEASGGDGLDDSGGSDGLDDSGGSDAGLEPAVVGDGLAMEAAAAGLCSATDAELHAWPHVITRRRSAPRALVIAELTTDSLAGYGNSCTGSSHLGTSMARPHNNPPYARPSHC